MSKTNFNVLLEGSSNRNMGVDVYLNSNLLNKKPVVIFCHGYKGFKDWGAWNLVGKKFQEAGFNFIKFNFSHNGVTPQDTFNFTDLEAFGNNNYSKELFDLNKVINWVEENEEFSSYMNTSEIYLIGHSRGGGIIALTTAKDKRIKKAITWAGVSDLIERIPKNVEEWKEEGVVYQINGRTNQNMPLFYQFYENTQSNLKELSIQKMARHIKIPFCIIHGREDKVVKEEEAESLNEWISTSQFILIDNTGHTFGSLHPYDLLELNSSLKMVVEESITFLQKN